MDTASVAERDGEIIPVISFMEKMLIARAQAWTGTVRVFSRRLSVVVFFVLLGLAPPVTPQQNAKNVLVIFSIFDRQQIAYLDLIESPVRAHFKGPVNFYTTYLNPRKVLEKGYRESLAETLRRQYSDVKLDVVVAAAIPAIPFATDYRDRIFPGVPIVFVAVAPIELEGQEKLPGTTGVTTGMGLQRTIDLALHLHPDATAVAVIDAEQNFWWGMAHSELLRHQDKIKEIDILGQPSAQMLEKIAALPPHTVVLFQLAPAGSTEPTISNYDVLSAAARRLPTYSAWQLLCLNYGCIGGVYPEWEKDAQSAGELVARLLSGERPENIPVVHSSNLRVRVDSRALRRWNISETALPPGSIVLYREPTIWERDRRYLIAGIGVIAIQALLIIGLLWQRARRRKAQAVLRESEKRFRVMADTTPSLIWMCDAEGKVTYLNEQWIALTGAEPHISYSDAWTAYVHPGDLKNVLNIFANGMKSHQRFSMEYRLRRQDGVYRWLFDIAAPRFNGDRSFAGFIGSAVDVTDQKMAQEALEKVSGQLIAAQEKERSHLARELHDDICQRLAMLSLRIEKVTRGWGSSQKPVSEQLEEIWQQCSTLTGDVQALSHELHPSILDNLGLVTAVKSFCREVSQQSGAVVDFTERNIPGSLPREVSLSLFRVIQEALHNAIKYSGQKHFEVRLQGKADEIELEVSDRGAGFDVTRVKNGKGLGLVSMTERIHLLNGRISIDSKSNAGTKISACVPFFSESKPMDITAN
jgi:PAS domain S-box-containing protein